ncbi:MAG: N-acetyl sugar amidotransferase, partial [Clostridiales bacterium]|nr:N-acetyl sugar amidotransferase [Clostridiales bacterium]
MKIFKTCSVCLMPETRPRMKFDENGICSACKWHEEKKTLDWEKRENVLTELIAKHKGKGVFDCLVPVSGGKDSSYVAHMMKNKYGLRVLTLTIRPDLVIDVGEKNLDRFISAGYDNIKISPAPDVVRKINKIGFVEQGRPFIGWQIAVQAVILKIAYLFNIKIIMYGENGETEYGGTTEFKEKFFLGPEDINILLENNSREKYSDMFSDDELYWLTPPTAQEISESGICYTYWSYFENWDSHKNELVAIENFNIQGPEDRNIGTYTRLAQNDTKLYSLHT